MTMALLGWISPIIGALVHAAIVRFLPVSLRLASVVALSVLAFVIGWLVLLGFGHPLSIAEWLVALAMTVSLSYAYILAFMLVLYDSPTMSLVTIIGDHEPQGMPVEAITTFIRRNPFMQSRLDALIVVGVVEEKDSVLIMRKSVGLLMQLNAAYRRFSRRDVTTG